MHQINFKRNDKELEFMTKSWNFQMPHFDNGLKIKEEWMIPVYQLRHAV